jgi:hypothetical protein
LHPGGRRGVIEHMRMTSLAPTSSSSGGFKLDLPAEMPIAAHDIPRPRVDHVL